MLLKRFLHFSDNEASDRTDALYKVRPVLDYILNRFKIMYTPQKNISIDEGMMLWKGRLGFKVYCPNKPIKWGLRSYILAESSSGYVYSMKPYSGEGSTLDQTVPFLLGDLAHKGYHLYMDNFYNSVNRCGLLQELGTQVCGTVRRQRGEPPEIKRISSPCHLKEGERVTSHNGKGVLLTAWRDGKKIVRMVTTIHENKMVQVEGKKGARKKRWYG